MNIPKDREYTKREIWCSRIFLGIPLLIGAGWFVIAFINNWAVLNTQ